MIRIAKKVTILLYTSAAAAFMFPAISASGEHMIKVREIEFRGLKYLAKNEIIRKIDVRADETGITLDNDALIKVLKGTAMIRDFTIARGGDRLLIHIVEKKPYAALAMRRGDRLLPFEVDEKFNVISRDIIYSRENPLIIIGQGDAVDGQLQKHVIRLCSLLKMVEKSDPGLFSQISELSFIDKSSIIVVLSRRKTRFELQPDMTGFNRLKHVTGYFDRISYYPDRLTISGKAAIMKP